MRSPFNTPNAGLWTSKLTKSSTTSFILILGFYNGELAQNGHFDIHIKIKNCGALGQV